MKIIIFFSLLLVFASCNSDDGGEVHQLRQRMSALSFEINTLIEDRSCNGSADCATIGLGSKACGGPVTYLIFSRSTVDVATLQALVTEFNDLEARVNDLTGAVSDCALEPVPVPDCVNSTCQVL